LETYALGFKRLGYSIEKGEYHYVNLAAKESSQAIVWLTEKRLADAEQRMLSNAMGLRQYLIDNNLYHE